MDPISYQESLKILQQLTEKLRAKTESLPVRECNSRVLTSPIHALRANPAAAIAAMDGIAVDAGKIPDALVRLRQDQWQFINTGEVLPGNFNAVIKIEDVQWEEKVPVLDRQPNLYQNVRRPGEDFEKGTLLFPSERQLHPQDISLALAAGCESIEVYKRPVISFIPTGSELVQSHDPQEQGKIPESNSAMVAGLTESWGAQFRLMDLVPDDADDLAQMLKLCVQNSDCVVISAGTSKGTKDITAEVIRFMGTVHFHGVQISPGKPVLLGEISGIPVLGLPGYPAAAYLCSYLYLRQIVGELSHIRSAFPRSVLISSEDIAPRPQDSFYRVNCFEVDGQTFVRRIEGGAGSIASISQMDGLMHVPPQTQIKKRDGVRIDIVRDYSQNTIAARGVFDPGLFHLFTLVRSNLPSQRLLFWQSSGSDALQTIIERSLHVATISTPDSGPDPFESWAKQLQEPMHRYRAFTRTIGLITRDPAHQELSRGMKVVVPESHRFLWDRYLEKQGHPQDHFLVMTPSIHEKNLGDAFQASRWDALFADIRFLKDAISPLLSLQEHLDIVIPDSYMELSGIRKLIEMLMSEEQWMWLERQKGCTIDHRGLVK